MKTLSYIPSRDKLVLKLRPLNKKPTKKIGRFKLWWDEEGYIYGVDITQFMEELKEFSKSLNMIRLGGIWKGVRIEEEDIKEIRRDLLTMLQERR